MDRLDNIGENEIRIIGSAPENEPKPQKRSPWTFFFIIAAVVVLGALAWFFFGGAKEPAGKPDAAPKDNAEAKRAYVEISDTMINNVSLHRFIPLHARPSLVMGVMKEFPSDCILGAMAADFGLNKGEYQVIGAFVHQGKMLSYSRSKYGFCALLSDTVVMGNELTTSYFERAIKEGGDFFRQYALVHNGQVVSNPPTHNDALRRALCRMKDGQLGIIDTDMSVSLDSFSTAISQYGVVEAVALMGSGAAVRWAVDKQGRRFIAGADEYDFPDVVNYIVWRKEDTAQ